MIITFLMYNIINYTTNESNQDISLETLLPLLPMIHIDITTV